MAAFKNLEILVGPFCEECDEFFPEVRPLEVEQFDASHKECFELKCAHLNACRRLWKQLKETPAPVETEEPKSIEEIVKEDLKESKTKTGVKTKGRNR